MAPQVSVTDQATWTHPRRATIPAVDNGMNTRKVFSNPLFLWSTDVRCKKLVPQYLSLVHAGIVAAASDLRLPLDPGCVEWLSLHTGRFPLYIPPSSEAYKHLLTSVLHKDKPLNKIAGHVLTQNHSVVCSSPRFCKGAVSVNYQSSMESSLQNLWNFLAMLGAYQCMLILLPHPPTQCCSLSTTSVKAYVLHKFNPHNTYSLYESWNLGGEAVHDLYHSPMKCEGTVRNKDGFDTLFATLAHLHDDHAKKIYSAGYVLQCTGCFAKFKLGGASMTRFDPCEAHAGRQSKYCCMGNPSSPAKTMKDLVTWLDKESERRGYEVKEMYFILPQDILDLHQFVSLVHYNMWDLQNVVVLLGGIYTAGRFDGYHDLDMSNFCKCSGLFDVSEHKINSLAQRVKEKTDKV
jgi:hypothetical protein